MQLKNVEPVFTPRDRIGNPAVGRSRGSQGIGAVATATIHFVGDREDDITLGNNGTGRIPGDQAHERVRVLVAGIVIRGKRDTFGAKPVHQGGRSRSGDRSVLEKQGLGTVQGAGHVPGIEPLVGAGDRLAENNG